MSWWMLARLTGALMICTSCGAAVATPLAPQVQLLPTLTPVPTASPQPPTATRAPTRAPVATATSGLLSALLSSPTPGPRPGATVAPTAAPTNTPAATETPLATAVATVRAATDTPAPTVRAATDTPAPTVRAATNTPEPAPTRQPTATDAETERPTARPQPTRTPLPTSPPPTLPPPPPPAPTSGPPGILYDTPTLINPPSGQRHTGQTGPAVSWQPLHSGLQQLDYYAFTIHHSKGWDVRCYKGSRASLPEYMAILQPPGGFDGFVVVLRLKAPVAEGDACQGDPVSYQSNISNFYWTRQ